jgi:predicted dehydrogenase
MARIGIVGTGWGARVQVPAFRSAGLEVAGIAGFHRNKTARVAEELGVRPFDDWRAVIASDIDCVSIVTPPDQHLEMATAALDAGKHVISEKPTALDAGEAEKLVAAARRHPDRIAIIDHELRFLPSWLETRPRMREIGALGHVEVRYSSPSRGDRTREWNWWSDAARGGGVWGAVGSHFIDAIRYFGFEIDAAQALLHTVVAERPYGSEKRPVTSDDLAAVHLRLAGGAVATMTFSAVASGSDEPTTLTFHGEEGSFRMVGEEVLRAKRGGTYERAAGGDLQKLAGNSAGGAFGTGTVHLARALRAALQGDRAALASAATFEDGLAQQKVLDAARRSNATDGRWVHL